MAQARLRRSLAGAGSCHESLCLLADLIDTQHVSVMSARVGWLVMSCHRIGRTRMLTFLRTLRLNEQVRVRDLSDARRKQVTDLLRELH